MIIPPIKDAALTVETRTSGSNGVVAVFKGLLTARDPGPLLSPFFTRLHQVVVEEKRKSVQVDLRLLKFMNSASFKQFVSWVKTNGAMPPAQRYAIHFILNPKHHWQEVSLHALRCFSMDEITAELSPE